MKPLLHFVVTHSARNDLRGNKLINPYERQFMTQADLKEAQQLKLKEVQEQQAKLKELQADLAKLNAKVKNKEQLTAADTEFIGSLGWISALSVTIAAIAATV